VSDLVIRGGWVVSPVGVLDCDVVVADGQIEEIVSWSKGSGDKVVDATGLHVFPGGIDSHVHFNEPGHTDWETIANGTAALAAGGYTSFIDMPLNSLPVTIDAESFDAKLRAMNASSVLDFGIWAGLVPGNLDDIEELVECGAMGFKAFMCPSGLGEFPACDQHTLREGMKRIAAVGSVLLLHAEDPEIVESLRRTAIAAGRTGAIDFVRSRPAAAEVEAIKRAISLAAETDCHVHIVHVSTASGMRLIQEANQRAVNVSCETCPHYLLYTEDDVERLGGPGKCAPPFRTTSDQAALWRYVAEDPRAMVVSDHSPCAPDLKHGDNFFKLWGGISGCQTTRQLLLAESERRSVNLLTIAEVTSTNMLIPFAIEDKGRVALNLDADLWLVDLSQEAVLREEDLRYLHPSSPHVGRKVRGRTVLTMVRGETVFANARVVATKGGRMVKPAWRWPAP
jgi:allantoinase